MVVPHVNFVLGPCVNYNAHHVFSHLSGDNDCIGNDSELSNIEPGEKDDYQRG